MCLNEKSALERCLADTFRTATTSRLADDAATAETDTGGVEVAQRVIKRSKLWQLESRYHCPVVGTCLSVDELVKFGRRFGFSAKPGNPYALHVEAVGHVKQRNEVSEAIQRHLDRKYGAALATFDKAKSDAAVRALWEAHVARGDVAGPMWAALTHKRVEEDTRRAVYAEVHMLSHQVGAGQAADLRRLAHLEQENHALRAAQAQWQNERQAAEALANARLQTLQREVDALRNDTAALALARARLAKFESGAELAVVTAQADALRQENQRLRALAERSVESADRVAALVPELEAARLNRARLERENEALERMLLALGNQAASGCGNDCARCENNYTTRCVLCVGGRPSLVAHYRALAERLGIRLIHHDGGLEESLSRLPEMINSADAVLCPTDCIGHAAYYRLKQHCRRTSKPCLLFKGAGVSSFALALSELSAGRVSLCGEETRQ